MVLGAYDIVSRAYDMVLGAYDIVLRVYDMVLGAYDIVLVLLFGHPMQIAAAVVDRCPGVTGCTGYQCSKKK
jgi:hypothetical protein